MNDRLYISPPSISHEEIMAATAALKSNWIATAGSYIELFEKKIEGYIGCGVHAIVLNSGTSAIHLGLLLLGVKNNDEVIIQSNTHVASINPILYLGAKPILVDSEAETWNICPIQLEEAIKERISKGVKPKAIIVVDLYGVPCKYEEIMQLSKKYQIPVLEDAAEAIGSSYKGKKCGVFGALGVISFNGNKLISTSAGGVLLVKTKELKQKAKYLANQAKLDFPHYEHKDVGYNYGMTNLSASIGCAQLSRIDELLKVRKACNLFYIKLAAEYNFLEVKQFSPSFNTNFWLTTIIIKDVKVDLQKLMVAFEKENIETRRLWKPMHLQPLYNECQYFGGDVSRKLFDNGLCMPSGTHLSDENKKTIKKVFDSFFNIKV